MALAELVDTGEIRDAVQPRPRPAVWFQAGKTPVRLDVGVSEDRVHRVDIPEEMERQFPQHQVMVFDE